MSTGGTANRIPQHRAKGGVFITRGAQLSIPIGGLRISLSDDGELESSVTVHVGLNLAPVWISIALDHLLRSELRHADARIEWQGTDDNSLGEALLQECEASMQAIVAAAISLDAFFTAVHEKCPVPKELRDKWRANRTARYKQVAELTRQVFSVKPRNAVRMRHVLRQIYRYRDWAVHPPAAAREPVRHAEFIFLTEWRFVAFSFANAKEIVRASLSLMSQAAAKIDGVDPRVRQYCAALDAQLRPIIARWNAALGDLNKPLETNN